MKELSALSRTPVSLLLSLVNSSRSGDELETNPPPHYPSDFTANLGDGNFA